MDDLENIRTNSYVQLQKIRTIKINELFYNYGGRINLFECQILVDKSIEQTVLKYEENEGANIFTFFQLILDRYAMNYDRDNTINEKKIKVSEDSEEFKDSEESETVLNGSSQDKKKYFHTFELTEDINSDSLIKHDNTEEELDMEKFKESFSNFVDKKLKGKEKVVANMLIHLIFEKGNNNESNEGILTWRYIGDKCNIEKNKVYKIKERITTKLKAYIESLPEDLKKLYRKLTFEPKPGDITDFANSLRAKPEIFFNHIIEISTFEKLTNLMFAYQNKKFNNFFNNNISDVKIKMIYDHLK